MKTLISIITIILFFSIAWANDALKKGEDFLKTENYLQAKEFFQKFTEDPKLADRALLGLAKAEYFLGNYYEATIPLKRLLRDFKNSSTLNEANLYMGLTYLKIGRLRDAEYYLEKVQQPLEKQAMIGKGWIAFYKGDLRTLQAVLQRLDRKDFNDPETDLLRIKYLAMTGKADEALKEFNKNLKLRKTLYDLDRADVLIRATKFKEAEDVLKKFIEKSNKQYDTIKAKKMLFEMYLTQGKTEEALKIGKEIYFYIPTDDVRLKIYSIYMNSKNYDEALRMLFLFRDKELKNKKIEEFLKTIMHKSPEKAANYIVKIYPFLPADSSLLIQSAQFLISQGRYNEAKNLLRKVQTGTRRAEAVIPYSQILIKEGKYKEAKKFLEPLKEKNPQATALYAQILAQEGDKLTALSYLRRVSKSIKDPEILTLLGDLEYSNGDRKKAIHYWLEASKLGNAEAALKAADYFYLSKKIKEAIQYYKKAIDAGIKDNNSLMWAYYQYGKLAHDKTYLEKVAASKGELSEAARALLH
ncbi:tetratricopeptide repeat protein [Thermodesulfovibrio sp. 3907-1M]|uniref:Tetratricopeptide repeat protein n=1 Tax=Thermodesulfovibrio autotrophicus TaxID=3118333 RepID=A0AAU8GU79_9BACT